jgi:hypothetical protein
MTEIVLNHDDADLAEFVALTPLQAPIEYVILIEEAAL